MDGEKIMFSLSHSWPYAAVMLSGQKKSGVDIEYAGNKIAFNDLAPIVLTENEQMIMRRSKKPKITFLMFWTIKEAVSKALGCGLSLDFSRISITNDFEVFLEQRKLPLRPLSVLGPDKQYVLASCALGNENSLPVIAYVSMDNIFESAIFGEAE
jgi:phosphopantetheinyl transferase